MVVAFGQILPKAVLDVPARGSINVHASLLPRYRGAAPIAWAIIRGETETGITTFQMDPGMDTGDMLDPRGHAHRPRARRRASWRRAWRPSARRCCCGRWRGSTSITPEPQDHGAGHAGAPAQEGGRLASPRRAGAAPRRRACAGCNPWPGAALADAGRPARWSGARRPCRTRSTAPPGTLVRTGPGATAIATGDGMLLPVEVQPENRKAMAWEDFLRGARLGPGDRLTEVAA